ncbi:transcriptional regulator [Terriglobus roseus DSM 18391]|uniref:Transcriptional regulator n=1 Tax=Terriglobus roseus (strain DSM 18391 / NRRL B-41598 / KBS 63) TaxID=926566 RepID=I3ZED3_TERRK|nr:helix-turn-helix domain-containing protein [Terriglobus roseus]AFL87601.1 transcriptional regulator [Terriglobus roseus DSM 18391]
MDTMLSSPDVTADAVLQGHFTAATEHPHRDPYLVKSVVHASQILSAFHDGSDVIPLKEIVRRCGLPKSMVFRLLYTMTTCNIVEKLENNRYRLKVRPADDLPLPAETLAPKRRRITDVQPALPKGAPHIGLSSG